MGREVMHRFKGFDYLLGGREGKEENNGPLNL